MNKALIESTDSKVSVILQKNEKKREIARMPNLRALSPEPVIIFWFSLNLIGKISQTFLPFLLFGVMQGILKNVPTRILASEIIPIQKGWT